VRTRIDRRLLVGAAAAVALAVLVGLALRLGGGDGGTAESKNVVLVTHDSFVVSDDVKRAFERDSGLQLQILQTGDAGETLSKALLTAGNPQGDVLFGVDSNLLSRALEGDLFDAYEAAELAKIDAEYVLDPEHRVTPIDHGEVCLNYDETWFAERKIAPPKSLTELTLPRYEGLLVVQNPATSTPGLAFLLATIARYGEGDWKEYWRKLRANDVLVVDGWEEAYNVRFSGSVGSDGSRPIVVSYASSPPAEVIFRTPRPTKAPTAVLAESCFRQIEFAGVLRGASNPDGARELVDFLLSTRFQEDVPLSMYVFPVDPLAELPPEFYDFAVVPEKPLQLPPAKIEANRDRWIKEWTAIVLR
jgi:thiamine transport system substrate-binding protein